MMFYKIAYFILLGVASFSITALIGSRREIKRQGDYIELLLRSRLKSGRG